MNQEIIFISDVHISFEKKEITARFLSFLKGEALSAHSVYILGDLFDTWVGDDDDTALNKKIKTKLKQLTDSGTHVFFQPGNRDFLISSRFCTETGVILLDDYAVIDLFGVKTLLTHGDLLCSDDINYQVFRKKSRSRQWKQNVLSKPLLLRLFVARWYRFRSHLHKRKKTTEIMDVNQQTVVNVMKKYHCLRLVHGHTHRPSIHDFEIDGNPAQRFVLADWKKDRAELLSWNSSGYYMQTV